MNITEFGVVLVAIINEIYLNTSPVILTTITNITVTRAMLTISVDLRRFFFLFFVRYFDNEL